jgi:protein-disulfide isomerase
LAATSRPLAAAAPLGALLLALACGTAEGTAQDDLRSARTKGSATAPVTIYEMSDFQCPYCAQFVRTTEPALLREYVATGKAKLVFVNYPLPMHPNAEPAAELAMCAAQQGRFWQVHDLLFRHQEDWENLREPATYFQALGDSAGADRDQMVQCLRAGAMRELVRADAEGSTRSGATGTPSFYVEGGLMRGVIPIEIFRQVLDSIIRAKGR